GGLLTACSRQNVAKEPVLVDSVKAVAVAKRAMRADAVARLKNADVVAAWRAGPVRELVFLERPEGPNSHRARFGAIVAVSSEDVGVVGYFSGRFEGQPPDSARGAAMAIEATRARHKDPATPFYIAEYRRGPGLD